MISFIGEWIKYIVLLILMATFLDLILPNSSMRRYVKLVVGLLLILLILSPILKVLQFDYERLLLSVNQVAQDGNPALSRKVAEERNKMEDLQEAAVLEEVSRQWREKITVDIQSNFNLTVHALTLQLTRSGENVYVDQVSVQVREGEKPTQQDGKRTDEIKVSPVKPVVIDVSSHSPPKKTEHLEKMNSEQKKIKKEVLKYFVDEWNISVDKIYFSWKRG